MKYLAFDIEAANGYKPYSICCVGVVEADENFNILSKHNYWINPKTKYDLNGTRANIGINLNLDEQLLLNSPDFVQTYDTLKDLLSQPDTVIVGHAVESDVIMLNAACKFNKLPCIDFNFICSQLLYKCYFADSEVKALNKIAAIMNIEFNHHTADEDALMSLLTLKYLCQTSGKSVDELLDEFRIRWGKNTNGVLIRTVSLVGNISKKHIGKKAIQNIADIVEKLPFNNDTSAAFCGKSFAFSRSLEAQLDDRVKMLLEYIYLNGGIYTPKIGKCDYYIGDGTLNNSDNSREAYIIKAIAQGKNLLWMDIDEALSVFSLGAK